jgi:outer membrane protein assembly factor BamE (lipoprotein component of BamABCDE complex)
MRSRSALLVVGLLPAMVLSGCVMGRVYRDHPLDEVKIAAIQRGQTTKQEILDLFGPPQEIDARELTAIGVPFEPFISRRGDKPPVERIVAARYFRYTYTRANAMAIILILFNYGEFDQKSDNLVVFFDGDNKVEDFAFRRDTDQLPRYGFWSR